LEAEKIINWLGIGLPISDNVLYQLSYQSKLGSSVGYSKVQDLALYLIFQQHLDRMDYSDCICKMLILKILLPGQGFYASH
jgi:hypothetical protein